MSPRINNSPLGSGLSSTLYPMLGTSMSLASQKAGGNPTRPAPVGSPGAKRKHVAQVSVAPNPSITMQEKVIRKKLNTLGFKGAEPETMSLISPPSNCRTLGYQMLGSKDGHWEVSHLLKYETIPKRVSIDAGGFEPFEFSLDCASKQSSLETRGICGGHDCLINLVQQPGNRREEVRFQHSHILDDPKGRPREVADSPSSAHHKELGGALRCDHTFNNTGRSLKQTTRYSPRKCERVAGTTRAWQFLSLECRILRDTHRCSRPRHPG